MGSQWDLVQPPWSRRAIPECMAQEWAIARIARTWTKAKPHITGTDGRLGSLAPTESSVPPHQLLILAKNLITCISTPASILVMPPLSVFMDFTEYGASPPDTVLKTFLESALSSSNKRHPAKYYRKAEISTKVPQCLGQVSWFFMYIYTCNSKRKLGSPKCS